MGRPRKTLLERVLENSFRPGRYGFLLGIEQLPARCPAKDRRRRLIWARLREVQDRYRAVPAEAPDAEDRRAAYARAFGSYVCGLHGRLVSWLPLKQPPPRCHEEAPTVAPGPPEYVFSVTLRCEECGWENDDGALGWVALLGYDPREDDFPTAVVYCPDCAEREFELEPGRERPSGNNERK
jgi:hypothetical protein